MTGVLRLRDGLPDFRGLRTSTLRRLLGLAQVSQGELQGELQGDLAVRCALAMERAYLERLVAALRAQIARNKSDAGYGRRHGAGAAYAPGMARSGGRWRPSGAGSAPVTLVDAFDAAARQEAAPPPC